MGRRREQAAAADSTEEMRARRSELRKAVYGALGIWLQPEPQSEVGDRLEARLNRNRRYRPHERQAGCGAER